jgi:hypothetical protein
MEHEWIEHVLWKDRTLMCICSSPLPEERGHMNLLCRIGRHINRPAAWNRAVGDPTNTHNMDKIAIFEQ